MINKHDFGNFLQVVMAQESVVAFEYQRESRTAFLDTKNGLRLIFRQHTTGSQSYVVATVETVKYQIELSMSTFYKPEDLRSHILKLLESQGGK